MAASPAERLLTATASQRAFSAGSCDRDPPASRQRVSVSAEHRKRPFEQVDDLDNDMAGRWFQSALFSYGGGPILKQNVRAAVTMTSAMTVSSVHCRKMPSPSRPPLTPEERAGLKQWLENWRIAGPVLEAERAARVAALTDQEASRMALDLWRLAIPGRGDQAAGLLELKRLVAASRRK